MSDLSKRCWHALTRQRHMRSMQRLGGVQIGTDTANLADARVVLEQLRPGDRPADNLAVVHVDDLEIIRRVIEAGGDKDAIAAFERLSWGIGHDD